MGSGGGGGVPGGTGTQALASATTLITLDTTKPGKKIDTNFMAAHPSAVEKVVLVDLRDHSRWELRFEPEVNPDVTTLNGPGGKLVLFTRAQIGSACDFTTRDDTCSVTMPTPGQVRTFRCSVDELQPLLHWLRLDLAPFERARAGRELLSTGMLGALWILAGSPILGYGVSYWLIGYGTALVVLGIVGRLRPHRALLIVDALLWTGVAVQTARVAYAGSGVLAVVMTLFAASYVGRIVRAYTFLRTLARK